MQRDGFDVIWQQLGEKARLYVLAVEAEIERLCGQLVLEPPIFSLGWDVSETTAALIRLGIPNDEPKVAADVEARHIFAHWLCNLEGTDDSDKVADAIAGLLKKPVFQVEGVVEFQKEDDGMALICESIVKEVIRDPHMFVRVQSWDEERKHPLAQSLVGKKIRVTIEVIE